MPEMTHRMERDGRKIRLYLTGEIDMSVATDLRALLHGICSENPEELVVDLSGVPFMDSSGVATLVEALRILRKSSSVLRVENPTQPVRYTFEITRLAAVFGIEGAGEQQG